MTAIMERQRTENYCLFDHKLSPEELEEVLANWEYDPSYYDDDDDCDTPAPLWDIYGNPTRETLDAMYEDRHDIGETMTWEEFCDELQELYDETEPCGKSNSGQPLRAI